MPMTNENLDEIVEEASAIYREALESGKSDAAAARMADRHIVTQTLLRRLRRVPSEAEIAKEVEKL